MSGGNLDAGRAQGVLTERLTIVGDTPLTVDISTHALTKTLHRVGDRPGLELGKMAFPRDQPDANAFDLVVLSKVDYYFRVESAHRTDTDRLDLWVHA